MLEFLNKMRDVMGVPFYPVIFQALMVLTFAIHIIFVNIVMGGTALAIWCRIKGGEYNLRLSRALARSNTIMTSLAIVIGVAPLLFVQVIYDPFWYTSAQMSAWWAMLFLVAITAAFTFAYLFYLGGKGENEGGSLFWSIASFISLIVAAVIIHVISMQMLHPEKWSQWVVQGNRVNLSGWQIHAVDIFRLLHFIIPAFAITGVYLMLYGWYFRERYSQQYTQWVAETGAKLALYASCIQGLAGIVWWLTTPSGFKFHPITLIGVLAGAAFVGYLFKMDKTKAIEKAIPTSIFAFVVVLLMSVAREFLRFYTLKHAGYSPYTYKLNLSVGSTILFFATFIMGLVVISYPIALAYKAGKKEGTVEATELNTLGRIAATLPVIWFVVVAGLGVIISIKNGTLF